MRLKIIRHIEGSDFECVDENGKKHRQVDIFVDGMLPKHLTPKDMIGKTIECAWLHPFIEIACDVRLAPSDDARAMTRKLDAWSSEMMREAAE